MSEGERIEFLKGMKEISEKEYEENLKELQKYITNFDIITMLCHFSMYFLTDNKGLTYELQDNSLIQFHIELLQALSLQIEVNKEIKPFLGENAVKIEELIKTISYSFIHKRMANIKSDDENELKKLSQIELFRIQNMTVRNWGYREQVLRVTKELFKPIDEIIKNEMDISIIKLLDMLERLLNSMETKLNEKTKLMRDILKSENIEEMVDLFVNYYSLNDKEKLLEMASEAESNEDFANYLNFVLGDQLISYVFSFDVEDCIKHYSGDIDKKILKKILDSWSYKFGELKDFETEHIFFGNPIWSKPLINFDGGHYCWPVPGLFISFCIELMESICNSNSRIKRIYEKRRSSFLEDQVENLFDNSFQNIEVYPNLIRVDEDGENDLLVLVDTHAFIVESKSGKISAPARRGAPKTLKREIEKLLIESSEQAKNFENYIENNLKKVEFTNKDKEKIIVDLSKVKHIHSFSVTLDLFGPLASRTPLLLETKLIEKVSDIIPSMSLVDLEIIFEMLETNSEKIHYFIRRSQLDKNTIYHADELDLLAFYLKTGFNIGDTEFRGMPLELYGESEEVFNDYYLKKIGKNSRPIPKPRPRRTKWFNDIIKEIEKRKTPGYSEITFMLLNVSFEDQIIFENGIKKVKKNLNRKYKKRDKINSIILINGPEERKELILAYCFKTLDRTLVQENIKNLAIQSIMESGVNPALVIGIKLKNHYPYSIIGLIDK